MNFKTIFTKGLMSGMVLFTQILQQSFTGYDENKRNTNELGHQNRIHEFQCPNPNF